MLPDRVSNPGPLTYESGALPIALRGPALLCCNDKIVMIRLDQIGVVMGSKMCIFARDEKHIFPGCGSFLMFLRKNIMHFNMSKSFSKYFSQIKAQRQL